MFAHISYRVFHLRPVGCQDTVHHIDAVAVVLKFHQSDIYSRVLSIRLAVEWVQLIALT